MIDQVMKSLKTISEMMFDRGFRSFSRKIKALERSEIHQLVLQKHIFYFDFEEENGSTLRLLYAMQPKFKLSEIKKLLEEDFDLTLIILREKMSTTNIKSIDEYKQNLKDIQVFHLSELMFNKTHHYLVPKHELMGAECEAEIQKLVEMYLVRNRFQFPWILKSDPIAKYFNGKTGNLFKITRSSPTAGEYVEYRCCA